MQPSAFAAPQAQPPASRKALWLIVATIFLNIVGSSILLPVLPFLVRQFNSDAITIGLLALSFAAAQFFASPLLGLLSDRYGRRPVLIISLIGSALGYCLFGLATALWLLFVARVIDGITGGNISTAQAYISDITPPQERAKNFGLIGAAFGLGFIVGPALGGLLSQFGLAIPAFAAAALYLLTAAFGYFVLPESLPPERRKTSIQARDLNPVRQIVDAFRRTGLPPFLLATFAINFAFAGLSTNFPVFTLARFGLGPEQNALIYIYLGILSVLMQGVATRYLVKRFNEQRLSVVGLAAQTVAYAALAFAPSVWSLYGVLAVNAIGRGMATPTLQSQISKRVSFREQGMIFGATQALVSLSQIFGPLWAGVTFDYVSEGAPYWTGALWILGALALVATVRQVVAAPQAGGWGGQGGAAPGAANAAGGWSGQAGQPGAATGASGWSGQTGAAPGASGWSGQTGAGPNGASGWSGQAGPAGATAGAGGWSGQGGAAPGAGGWSGQTSDAQSDPPTAGT
jgi:multidrug resistance protein